MLSLQAASDHLSHLGRPIQGWASLQSLLVNWTHDWPLLEEVAQTVRAARAPQLLERMAPLASLTVHAPLPEPHHIYCAAANYRTHVVQLLMAQPTDETRSLSLDERRAAAERKMDERARSGAPFFFLKSQSAVTGPFDAILLPPEAKQVDWELELAVIIGRTAQRVSRDRALNHVAGYTIANDITRRELVYRRPGDGRELGLDWVAAKCARTFLPLGPFMVPAAFVPDPQSLQVTLRLNDVTMQDASTADMLFDVARLIEHLSAVVELQPGDVICTGSPHGNGAHYGRFLRPGDRLESSISGLGTQRNVCSDDRPRGQD